MAKHTSEVNFKNLIRDLAEMYPLEVSEVVLVELVANALDAKASKIYINFDPDKKILTVTDNGSGMTHDQFDEYHDFAAGLKTRGSGIGFAGVGAKISFNIASQVVTETKSNTFSGGSNWYLQPKGKLVWEDINPNTLHGNGTMITVNFLSNSPIAFSSTEDLINLLKRQYLPLLDLKFLKLYEQLGYYSKDFRFIVNNQTVTPVDILSEYSPDKSREFFLTSAGKRTGYGIFGLSLKEYPLGINSGGVLLCTHGKVIKSDLFNQFPGSFGPRILGIVEIPDLIAFLTTSKTDFTYTRSKIRKFEKLYDPVRQEFKSWLKELGVEIAEPGSGNEERRLERELKKLLAKIPELSDFFGFQTKKDVFQKQPEGPVLAEEQEGSEITYPSGGGAGPGNDPAPADVGDQPGEALIEVDKTESTKAKPISRTGRSGPKVSFSSRPDKIDMAWVDGNNVIINSGHLSYIKVASNNLARTNYSLFAIANAIQRFINFSSERGNIDLMFVDRVMAAWGEK